MRSALVLLLLAPLLSSGAALAAECRSVDDAWALDSVRVGRERTACEYAAKGGDESVTGSYAADEWYVREERSDAKLALSRGGGSESRTSQGAATTCDTRDDEVRASRGAVRLDAYAHDGECAGHNAFGPMQSSTASRGAVLLHNDRRTAAAGAHRWTYDGAYADGSAHERTLETPGVFVWWSEHNRSCSVSGNLAPDPACRAIFTAAGPVFAPLP